jgi:hypothetical protein
VEILVKSKATYIEVNAKVELAVADIEITETTEGDQSTDDSGVVPSAPHTTYSARLQVGDFPDEGEMRMEIDSVNHGNESLSASEPLFHFKISFDAVELVLAHRMLQLEQAQEVYDKALKATKEAKRLADSEQKKSASPRTKSTKGKRPQSKKAKEANAEEFVGTESSSDKPATKPSVSLGAMAVEYAQLGLGMAVQHRAVLLFGLAVAGIFNYGELASV